MNTRKVAAYVCSVALLGVALLCWFHGRFDPTNGVVEGPNLKFGESTVISREDAGAGKFPKLTEITIVRPKAKQVFRSGEPIEVEVKVTDVAKKPELVSAELKIKGAIADSCTMAPADEAPNSSLRFVGKLKGQNRPGFYHLTAIGLKTIWVEQKQADKQSSISEKREHRVLKSIAPDVMIEVKR